MSKYIRRPFLSFLRSKEMLVIQETPPKRIEISIPKPVNNLLGCLAENALVFGSALVGTYLLIFTNDKYLGTIMGGGGAFWAAWLSLGRYGPH